jgi:CRISPR-associated protein Csd1
LSWISNLYDTYENCKDEIGKEQANEKTPLLPISHSTQNAHLEVTLDKDGNFSKGEVVDIKDKVTIIPCTENSSSRSGSAVFPHPLCDKLQYVAGDYTNFGGVKGDEFYTKYIEQLENWCGSPYSNKKAIAILSYLKKKTLISDLVKNKVLFCDANDKLLKKWDGDKNHVPKIFKVLNSEQSEAFVRFKVQIAPDKEDRVWLDKNVWDSYIAYYLSGQSNTDLCYIQGVKIPCSEKHPSKIRNTADKGKLISANDANGFTYRGRLSEKSQVVSVGYETSQKAHNALKWLIDKQGYKNGNQVIIAWGSKNEHLPDTFADSDEFLADESENRMVSANTHEEYAKRLNNAIKGYGKDLDVKTKIVVIGLDSATTGRVSITYYRELDGSDFLERIKNWHSTCVWQHTYKYTKDGIDEKGKDKYKRFTFIGAPSPKDIVEAAYGRKVSDKLKKSTIERLLPCIIDGDRIPRDIVNCTVHRASNPVSMDKMEWEKALSIACALYIKYDKKEKVTMALDCERNDRDYLYGRLLAIADKIESMTYENEKNRQTNAMRYMNMFAQRPFKTWTIISLRLIPYQAKLGGLCGKYNDLLSKVNSLFKDGDCENDGHLDGRYLLGYYCQRQVFIDERNQRILKKEQDKLKAVSEN